MMTWTAAAEAAHGEALAVIAADIERRYGLNAALVAEDRAAWILEEMARDFAREDGYEQVTAAHVARAAQAYHYRAPLAARIGAAFARIAAAVTPRKALV
jgi:hypothetical protein